MIHIYKLILKSLIVLKSMISYFFVGKLQLYLLKKINRIINKYFPNIFDDYEFLCYVKKKKLGLETKFNKIETLAIRGSYADYGFIPNLIPNSYNFGLTSSDLYISYYQYLNYSKTLINLKNVIYFLNIPSPGYSLAEIKEKYRSVSYYYFFNIPFQNKNKINSLIKKHIIRKCERLNTDLDADEYYGFESIKRFSKNSASIRVKTHLRENLREPDQLEWFFKISEAIKNDDRNFIVVIPPFRSDYRNLLPPKNELFKKFYSINNSNTYFIDLYESDLFTDKDFGDTDHLNYNGALKLTKEIKRKLKIIKAI